LICRPILLWLLLLTRRKPVVGSARSCMRRFGRDKCSMNVNDEKALNVCRWVEKAEHDLVTATAVMKLTDNCPYDMICFHAQQCVEKYIKSLLLWLDIDFPKTHDLRVLAQRLPGNLFKLLDMDKVLELNRYAIEARYPDDWEPFSRVEARRAVATAQRVRRSIRIHLPKTYSCRPRC